MINKIRKIDKINLIGFVIVGVFILPLLISLLTKILTLKNIII
jgi:hypothetical protein